MKTFVVSTGSESQPWISGASPRSSRPSRPLSAARKSARVPIRKSGVASRRNQTMRSQVFIAMFPSRGRRSGGISKMKSDGAPGTKREASQPTSSIEPPTAAMISAKPPREM